jgi:hypothetical protein
MALAPAPEFRYVGLEPIAAPRLGVAVAAVGLGAGLTLAAGGMAGGHAVLAGAVASLAAAFTLRRAGRGAVTSESARMAIVPWGVLVEVDPTPRILRWAAVRSIDVETSRTHRLRVGSAVSSRVAISTDRDRFVGTAVGTVTLEQLVEHVEAYASEQGTPIALALDGGGGAGESVEVVEPGCEMLVAAVRDWLRTASAMVQLGLEPAGYRKAASIGPTPRAVEVLGRALRDRTPREADPRAFAAVVAAELGAAALVPELVALAQCPNVLVAAVARLAARKLGAPRAKTGTLDELAPFLFDADRERLESWAKDDLAAVETGVT